jgi:hypothetical protein
MPMEVRSILVHVVVHTVTVSLTGLLSKQAPPGRAEFGTQNGKGRPSHLKGDGLVVVGIVKDHVLAQHGVVLAGVKDVVTIRVTIKRRFPTVDALVQKLGMGFYLLR